MSVKNLSDYDENGNKEHYPVWPFNMTLIPNEPPACRLKDSFHLYYDHIPPCVPIGWKLFTVLALDEPEEEGGIEGEIGYIETTSRMVTSLYGDTRLYFRHQRFEEDIAKKPHWEKYV